MNKYKVFLTVENSDIGLAEITIEAEDHDQAKIKAVEKFYTLLPIYKDLATVYGVDLIK